ncbi:hypothetical protein [Niabella ginsengisoli]|uniref:Uncharacterized protein n=1 Tax=Niabella ginsengisoli TaxID=522298 RepID=A0ABS9SHG7_9BACT|nr:hypothetical protein [Niabella ginsengisoli]MCH5597604.1 hypothetical protein [Niabella ginsengisoli]
MKQVLLIVFTLCAVVFVQGQKFISGGVIEFEVKTNIQKYLGYRWGVDLDEDDFLRSL